MTVEEGPTPERHLHPLVFVAVGFGSALLGLLPWIVTGMRLPLQYLWSTETLPADMPVALLPASQYAITMLVGLLVTAYAVAGIFARATATRRPRFALLLVAGTILVVQIVAIVQTTLVLEAGLADHRGSTLYVLAVLAVVAVAVITGLLVFAAIARGSRPIAVVALTIAALTTGYWINALVAPLATPLDGFRYQLFSYAQWIPAILVGVVIAWGGIRPVRQVVAAIVALLLLWVVPALATAVSAAAGSRILLPYPLEMLDYGWGVLRMALFMPELVVRPLVSAVIVAAVGLVIRAVIDRRG